MPDPIPPTLRSAVAGRAPDPLGDGTGPSGDAWLRSLPRRLDERLAAWDLVPEGPGIPAWHGECALVVPVRRADGSPAALKITWPHEEARTEHLALRRWDGRGAVRLLAAHPADLALLLERLDGDRDLHALGLLDACEEIGTLLARLDTPAPARIPTLHDQVPRWRARLARPTPLVPRRLLQQAASHLEALTAHAPGTPDQQRLVHTDLHFANVLAPLDAARGAWLAIDPKPLAAEGAFAVAPAVWNRADEAARAHSLAAHVRLRAGIIGDAAGLDEDRVRAWTFVRLVLNAVDASDHAPGSDAFRGRMIALAGAFANP